MKRIEPLYHSYISDKLPDSHKMAFDDVNCEICNRMVHSDINECMLPWFEFVNGEAICIDCFVNPEIYRRLNLELMTTGN